MGKSIKMHLPPKIIRLGYSTRSTIEEHTHMFNFFFIFDFLINFNQDINFFPGCTKTFGQDSHPSKSDLVSLCIVELT